MPVGPLGASTADGVSGWGMARFVSGYFLGGKVAQGCCASQSHDNCPENGQENVRVSSLRGIELTLDFGML